MKDETALLKKMGLDFELLDSGCCGMAGAFGFEKDHYDVSIKAGERVLLPRVRHADDQTLIIANGFSCREQIEQTTERQGLHLAQVMQMALHQQERPLLRLKSSANERKGNRSGASDGTKRWAIPEGYIPGWSHGPEPQMLSHEAVCLLNTSDADAHVTIMIYYADREPAGPYRMVVPARRTNHVRFNNLNDPEAIPLDTEYSSTIESDVPIVVQHTRLDSRQSENASVVYDGLGRMKTRRGSWIRC